MDAPARTLSDLEYTVLGIVWRRQGCTTYAVMQEFSRSLSTYYRGSAGSIYPLIKRLEERGLLESAGTQQVRRLGKLFRVSDSGLKALRAWIAPPIPTDEITQSIDLLRTRCYFLASIEPAERLAFVRNAQQQLEEQLKEQLRRQEGHALDDQPFSALALESLILTTQARMAWLEHLLEKLPELEGRGPVPPVA